MRFSFLAMCLITKLLLNAKEPSASDDWVGYWINGIEYTKDQQSYPKAVETYTTAIQALTPNQVAVQLNLVNERGDIYFKMLDFNNAIKDFSLVLNHPQVSQEQKIEALWGRSKAYLASGKVKEFEQDSHQLEQLQSSITPLAETEEYTILKVDPYALRDTISKERFIKLLLMRKEIKSEKDVTFTPSGLVIVKKVK